MSPWQEDSVSSGGVLSFFFATLSAQARNGLNWRPRAKCASRLFNLYVGAATKINKRNVGMGEIFSGRSVNHSLFYLKCITN